MFGDYVDTYKDHIRIYGDIEEVLGFRVSRAGFRV